MVELADSLDSGSSVHYARAGSSPASRTKRDIQKDVSFFVSSSQPRLEETAKSPNFMLFSSPERVLPLPFRLCCLTATIVIQIILFCRLPAGAVGAWPIRILFL